jgi:hypothetical protein
MLAVEKIHCRKHCPPRVLQDHEGEASSLPASDLWKDVLLEHQDTLLSTSAPAYGV